MDYGALIGGLVQVGFAAYGEAKDRGRSLRESIGDNVVAGCASTLVPALTASLSTRSAVAARGPVSLWEAAEPLEDAFTAWEKCLLLQRHVGRAGAATDACYAALTCQGLQGEPWGVRCALLPPAACRRRPAATGTNERIDSMVDVASIGPTC
jgi:hypothetical protein